MSPCVWIGDGGVLFGVSFGPIGSILHTHGVDTSHTHTHLALSHHHRLLLLLGHHGTRLHGGSTAKVHPCHPAHHASHLGVLLGRGRGHHSAQVVVGLLLAAGQHHARMLLELIHGGLRVFLVAVCWT